MVEKIIELLEHISELTLLEEYDEVLDLYDKILRIDPKNIIALIDKAVTLQRMGKNSLALKLFNNAYKLIRKI